MLFIRWHGTSSLESLLVPPVAHLLPDSKGRFLLIHPSLHGAINFREVALERRRRRYFAREIGLFKRYNWVGRGLISLETPRICSGVNISQLVAGSVSMLTPVELGSVIRGLTS